MDSTIQNAFESKRKYFDQGNTKDYEFRIEQLKKLKSVIKKNEPEILEALYNDLHKPNFEAFTSEIGVIYEEINYTIKRLKGWMKPKRVHTPMALQPATSKVYSEPLGVVLIIGPWNYPVNLLIIPLIGAIAAGNCAMIKPSDQARHTSDIITKVIKEAFPEEYISVVQGPGSMIGPMLIESFRFDHIFFTGSLNIGKKVAEMATRTLTPITLELGGKSPVIVDKNANLEVSARRLTWAKFFNAGQTCVCPDYLLVHEDVKDEFIEKMKHYIKEFFGDNPLQSDSFGRIINEKRFNVLTGLLEEGTIVVGGQTEKESRYIAPTIIKDITFDNKIMQEEIFGPILPVLTFKNMHEVVEVVRRNRYPLALYLYTKNKQNEKFILENIEFGGGCINNGLVHLANPNLPFGGVGFSGMGGYHGKYSFEVFSHKKSVVKTKLFMDPSLVYPPYNDSKMKMVKRFFK